MSSDLSKPFHASQFTTLTTHVQREIERRILSGEIPAGRRITETALAESLGVSRGPVREAIRWLAQSALVDIVANRGAIVREIGLGEALGLYDLRAVIFALACESLARRETDETCLLLRRKMQDMEQACAANDTQRYDRCNDEFHSAILAACGNARAKATYEALVKEMHLFRRRGLSLVCNMEASLREHKDIVEAIRAGEAEPAFRAGRMHIMAGKERFRATLAGADEPARQALAQRPLGVTASPQPLAGAKDR